MHHFAPNLNLR